LLHCFGELYQSAAAAAAAAPAAVSTQMVSGFTRLLSAADDLVLDIPEAVHLLSLFLGR
jgi:programmed cell death protein 4